MPDMSGPGLARELTRRGKNIPIVFITAQVEAARRSDVREGAIACLVKPFSESALLAALKEALQPGQ
jgi:FixJ family two-component response regulator